MLKIAITGNIASGKSQVETILKNFYVVFDADLLAHGFLNEITDFYGYDVFTDGKIDRKKLGELVFNNQDLRKKLENRIHPKVKAEIINIFEKNNAEKFVFVSIPLLFEANLDALFDKVIFIQADDEIRLKRLMSRNNLSEEQALVRINSQQKQEEKMKKSDFIIYNNGDLETLSEQVYQIINNLEK